MMIALDYGIRKCGLALSDETNTIAGMLPVLHIKNETNAIEQLCSIVQKMENIEKLVIGLPLGIDLKPTQMSQKIRAFSKRLSMDLPNHVQIVFTNEVLSTKQAEYGRSRKFRKEKSDSKAACIFLQEYLDHLKSQE